MMPRIEIVHGDSLRIMRELPRQRFQAIVTDPPYSSGAMFRGDRVRSTGEKYVLNGTRRRFPNFGGDTRDQRSFYLWAIEWLREALELTVDGGALLCFIDWRQLPTLTDAVQVAGWIYRGIIPWDKTEATRPQMGWFRSQCEYVVTATKGALGKEQGRRVRDCVPGAFRIANKQSDKFHQAGKPVRLLEELLRVVPEGGEVLDPFAGSGTTLIAARNRGLSAMGIESELEQYKICHDRIHLADPDLFRAAPRNAGTLVGGMG